MKGGRCWTYVGVRSGVVGVSYVMPYVIPSPRGAGGVVGVRCDEPARPLLYSRTFGDAPLSHVESRNSQPKNLNLIPATFSTALKRATDVE